MKDAQDYALLDFYVQYLRRHLADHHFDKYNNEKFISERADSALDTYITKFLCGHAPHICQELAMRTLLEGLFFSRYDAVHEVIEEDCWTRLSPETWEPTAVHMTRHPDVKPVLDRHNVNGDYPDDRQALHDDLLGTITEILDGYGL